MPAGLSRVGLLIERNKRVFGDWHFRRKFPDKKSKKARSVTKGNAIIRHNSDGDYTVMDESVFLAEMKQNSGYDKERKAAINNSVDVVF